MLGSLRLTWALCAAFSWSGVRLADTGTDKCEMTRSHDVGGGMLGWHGAGRGGGSVGPWHRWRIWQRAPATCEVSQRGLSAVPAASRVGIFFGHTGQ